MEIPEGLVEAKSILPSRLKSPVAMELAPTLVARFCAVKVPSPWPVRSVMPPAAVWGVNDPAIASATPSPLKSAIARLSGYDEDPPAIE